MKFWGGFFPGVLLLGLLNISVAQTFTAQNKTLLPPWFLLQAQLNATLNADPCVHVDELTGDSHKMEIQINVCDYNKAEALSAFVKKNYDYGNITLAINVLSPDLMPVTATAPRNLDETVGLLKRAFTGNKYFVTAGTVEEVPDVAFIEFKPDVVQFYSDDISDWYLNTNLVASQAFNDVMNFNPFSQEGVRVYATTSPIKGKV
jgi:hypothetical protein